MTKRARAHQGDAQGTISWEEHLEAWRAYDRVLGNGHPEIARTVRTPEEIEEEGGFSRDQLVHWLGREPQTWMPRRSTVTGPLDLAELDPGIRDIVAHLRSAGFETTDSGDGRSKEPDPEVLPFAHVAIASSPPRLLVDADAAQAFLNAAGVPQDFQVEATYWPVSGTAVVLVTWPRPFWSSNPNTERIQ